MYPHGGGSGVTEQILASQGRGVWWQSRQRTSFLEGTALLRCDHESGPGTVGGMFALLRTPQAYDVSRWLSWAVLLLVPWGGAGQQGSWEGAGGLWSQSNLH